MKLVQLSGLNFNSIQEAPILTFANSGAGKTLNIVPSIYSDPATYSSPVLNLNKNFNNVVPIMPAIVDNATPLTEMVVYSQQADQQENKLSDPDKSAYMTREDYLKWHIAIYKESLNEYYDSEQTKKEIDTLLIGILSLDLSEVNNITIDGVDGLFDKIKQAVQGASEKAKEVVTKVVEKAKDVIKDVVTFPSKIAVELILSTMASKVAPFFLYAFIPESSTEFLNNNPKVAEKRKNQINVLDKVCSFTQIGKDTMYQHLRNGIKKGSGKSPEDLINEKAGYDINNEGIGADPLFTPAVLTAGITALIAAVPSILNVLKKKDAPSKSDYNTNTNSNNNNNPFIPDPTNEGGDDGKPKDDEGNDSFFSSTAGKIVMTVIPLSFLAGIVYMANGKDSKK